MLVLAGSLVASEGGYVLMCRLDAANGWAPVGTFLTLFASLFALSAAAYVAARRAGGGALPMIAVGAVLFRLTLLCAGLPSASDPSSSLGDLGAELGADLRGERVVYERFLLFDSDLWRYLWDGHVAAHGVNPYAHPPEARALDELGSAERGPATDGRAIWSDVRSNVSYPHVPTIYPPLAQALFRLSHAIAPGSVLVLKALVTLADLAAAALIGLALQAAGRPTSEVVFYAWNPLVVKAFAGSGHVDSLLVLALGGMAYASVQRSRAGLSAAFGLSVLAKLSPLVLLPLVLRYIGPRWMLLSLALVAIGYWPFSGAGMGLFVGLAAYAREWEFNAGPFRVLRGALTGMGAPPEAAGRLAGAAVTAAVALWLAWRSPAQAQRFAAAAVTTLALLVLLSPSVMPWYVTWLLPFAVVSGRREWVVFSALVAFAFLVMVDGRERAAALAAEYGLFLAVLAFMHRDRLRQAVAPEVKP